MKRKIALIMSITVIIGVLTACDYEVDTSSSESISSTISSSDNTETTDITDSQDTETIDQDETYKQVRIGVTTTDLYVREGVGKSYRAIYVAPKGGQLEMTGNERLSDSGVTWYEVITPNGEIGWCSGDYLTITEETVVISEREEPSQVESPDTSSEITTGAYSFTTNDADTYKNGNSGKYAYKCPGSDFEWYFIIDFDEGTVYDFHDVGDDLCHKAYIKSGDLNSTLIVTYYDVNDSWESDFFFKWPYLPDHLLYQLDPEDDYLVDLYATDLIEALKIRDTKRIKDFRN